LLRKRITKPSGFNHIKNKAVWFDVLDNNHKLFGCAGFEIIESSCGIHFEIYKTMTHNLMKILRKDFNSKIKDLKQAGINKIVVSFPDHNNKTWKKFVRFFGFTDIKTAAFSEMEI